MQSLHVNSIIFFNDLDQTHTFNFDYRLARANTGMVTTAIEEGEEEKVEPKILFPYVLACFERREHPNVFHHRFLFLDLWQASHQDLRIFTSRQMRRYNEFARGLSKQLAEAKGANENTGLDSTRDMLDALKEDQDMDDAEMGIMNKEGLVYAGSIRGGRMTMEDVLEDPSSSFGGIWEDEEDGSQVPGDGVAPAKQYDDWVDACLKMCELQLERARIQSDWKRLLRIQQKFTRLSVDVDVRKLCTKYGFEGYE